MSLLRDIQNYTVSANMCTADLLRMCKILAARLMSKELNEWVDRELNGYRSDEKLPDYRVVTRLDAKGHFFGPFGASLSNAPIPTLSIPESLQIWVKDLPLKSGVVVYEDLLSSGEAVPLQNPWPPELIRLIEHKGGPLYNGYYCVQAWSIVPRGALLHILDAVRNKILGFALDIERENPASGEVPAGTVPVPPTVVLNVFNQHFHGAVANVSAGSHDFEQINEEGGGSNNAK